MRIASVDSSSSHHSSRSFVDTSALFPIETNAERPSPRVTAASRSASPSAPLCDEKPIEPGSAERDANVASRPRPGTAIPRQFGPIKPCAVRPDELEEPLLALDALDARLGEPGGDHDERPDARAERLVGGGQHGVRGDADHGEVDGIGDLRDRPVSAHPRDGHALAVDGVGGSEEVRLDDVPEELAADRAATARCADDRDAVRLEERPERCGHGDVVPLRDTFLEQLRAGDREDHLDLSALELARQLEAEGREHAEHLAVVRDDLGDEPLDPMVGGAQRQLLDEACPDPALLVGVRDGERAFRGGGVAEPHVARERDDPLGAVLDQRAQQCPALAPVGVDDLVDELRPETREAVEPQVEALLRERSEEPEDRFGIGPGGRAEPKRAPVAEDHVDDVLHAVIVVPGRATCIRSSPRRVGHRTRAAARPARAPLRARPSSSSTDRGSLPCEHGGRARRG